MRTAAAILLTLVLIAVLPAEARSPFRLQALCDRPNKQLGAGTRQVLAIGREGAVFVASRRGGGRVRWAWACSTRTRRVWQLTPVGCPMDCFRIGPVRLAGRYAAFGYYESTRATGQTGEAVLLNLRSGAARTYSLLREVRAIEVTPDGRAVWIDAPFDASTPGYEVQAGITRTPQVIDSGPGVDPASLALTGSRAYWLKDGQPQSIVLPPKS